MPTIFKADSLELSVWKIEESSDTLLSLLRNAAKYEKQLVQKRTEKRKQEWLACRVLLEEMVSRPTTVTYAENGAPVLADGSASISFSHTGGYVAVIIGKSGERVGVDIERRSDRVVKVKHKFMSPEELSFVDLKRETDHLMICWCAKEAIYKMMGEEGVDFANHIHIEPFSCEECGELNAEETKTPNRNRFKLRYNIADDYVLVYSE